MPRHASDPFLRDSTPLTEVLLLLSIKRHDVDTAAFVPFRT